MIPRPKNKKIPIIMNEKKKNLIIRTITGVLFVAIMIAGFLNVQAMILLFALITGLTMWEYTGLINENTEGVYVNRFISTVAGVYLFFAVAGWVNGIVNGFMVFTPYILTLLYLFISELYLKAENAIHNWAYTMLGQMYVALPFALINILGALGGNGTKIMVLPLCLFVFLWINDSGAYVSGSLFGKNKLFPRISPGKTWEGSIVGGLLVVIAACVVAYLVNGKNLTSEYLLMWVGLGIIDVFFGTWGDLVESLFKRTLGIKDSGNILPGHGGMLDRFDSSLLAIPAAVVYLYILQSGCF